LSRLRKICLALPGAVEFVSFGHPGWRVDQAEASAGSTRRSGRREEKASFAFYEEYKGERCIVFKAELPVQQALVKSPRFFVAPYIGKKGWVSLRCTTELDWGEIADLVRESCRLVTTPTLARRRGRSGRR
jgi:predicted DNA-binding protein (MmcQ/YjbR family)